MSKAPVTRAGPPDRRVRRRRRRDLPSCARILRLVEFEGYDLGRGTRSPRAFLDAPEVLDAWVVTSAGQVMGHAALSHEELRGQDAERWQELTGHDPSSLGHATRIFVRPRGRHRGIGTALLAHVTAQAHSRGLFPVLDAHEPREGTTTFLAHRGWRLRAVDIHPGQRAERVHRFAFPTAVGADLHEDGVVR